jgi:RNA polymerase sigma factor (sigma-70 family)
LKEFDMDAAMAFSAATADPQFRDPVRHRAFAPKRIGTNHGQAGLVIQFDEQNRRLSAWMKAAQDGDRIAYDNLLRASIPFIKMVARRQGVPADLLDDVVQETLLTVHRIRRTYDSSRPFTAWLRSIAQRRAIDLMRSQGRTVRREIHQPLAFENHPDPTASPEDQAEQVARRKFLGIAVAALPARQREAVEQLALNGKSFADAAIATGLTPAALSVNLHRAFKTLRADVCGRLTASVQAIANIEHIIVKSQV